jgi:uncharacterized damage-inducible protein DinB
MRKWVAGCAAALMAVAVSNIAGSAQGAANPFTAMNASSWNSLKKKMSAAAAAMPDTDYGFKPTPAVRSFGEIVGHLANDHYLICSGAKGEKNPSATDFEKTTGKAALVKALNESIAYCDAVFKDMDDKKAVEVVELFGSKFARLAALNINTDHSSEHYGNLVTYLRLKGVVPPSS